MAVRNYYYYGTGRIIHDQDLSACLQSSYPVTGPEHAPLRQQSRSEGPTRILPFNCRADGGCKCGIAAPDPSSQRSIYDGPLPSDDHIRLLELLPGNGYDQVECRLHVACLPRDKHTYCALSYTWVLRSKYGFDDETKLQIKVNGVPTDVSLNLAAALNRLRYSDASRIVWADALCINQGDLQERSHQVGMMKSIYENAFSLIIWLGPRGTIPYQPTPPVHLRPQYRAFSGLCAVVNAWRERSSYAHVIPEATHSRHVSGPRGERFNDRLRPDSPTWHETFHLFEQRWFSRVWVIQEVALARGVFVMWDEAVIDWENIGLAAAVIRTNYDRIASSIRQGPQSRLGHPQFGPSRRVPLGVVNAYFMYRLCRSQAFNQPLRFSFYELLKLTRQFDCKDDRDRVYGLLGLPTTDNFSSQIVPDYNKSAGEVYSEVAGRLVASEGLSVLSSVQRKHKLGAMRIYYVPRWDAYDPSVPSWVPQWSFLLTQSLRPPHQSAGARFRASGDRRYEGTVDPDDRRKLRVQGIIVDTVKSCRYPGFQSFWRGTYENDRAPGMRKFRSRRPTPEQRGLGAILEEARLTRTDIEDIALTLTAGQNWYGFPVEDVAAHLADYCRCLVKDGLVWSLTSCNRGRREGAEDYVTLEKLEQLSAGGNADRFLDLAATMGSRRAGFETTGGLVGLGPEATREGDQLCVLYGADMPFVIRQKTGGHALVGECYVRDLMRGQAVEGAIKGLPSPLAESWIDLI